MTLSELMCELEYIQENIDVDDDPEIYLAEQPS